MSKYLSKTDLLRSLTEIHERTVDHVFLGGAVLVREPTVRQWNMAREAATADTPDDPDTSLFHAMLIHLCVVDSESGTVDSTTGRIDPRTRTPLFTMEEALDIAEGRRMACAVLIEEITDLAAQLPRHLKSGDRAPDGAQRDAGVGVEGSGETTERDADRGSGDAAQRRDDAAQPE